MNVFWKTEDGFMLNFSDIDIDFVVVAVIHFSEGSNWCVFEIDTFYKIISLIPEARHRT